MAADFTLAFTGRRYPKATIKAAGRRGFAITPSDSGKLWEASEALGFWRDFIDVDLTNETHILDFVKARGLPFARADSNRVDFTRAEFTDHWRDLKDILDVLAAAWEEPGYGFTDASEIVSRQKLVDAIKIYDKDAWAKELLATDVKRTRTAEGKIDEAQTLAGFMLMSAILGTQHHVPMRRCDFCGSWYFRHRADNRFCTPSHRTQAHLRERLGTVPR